MYVCWRTLTFFGFLFWLLSCITDYIREDEPKFVYEEFKAPNFDFPEEVEEQQYDLNVESTAIRGLFVVLTLVIIALGTKLIVGRIKRSIRSHMMGIGVLHEGDGQIPIPLNVSITDGHDLESEKGPETSSDSSLVQTRRLEHKKRPCCNRHAKQPKDDPKLDKKEPNLPKKLELMRKEKRDLLKQLALAEKENRAAKTQLEEVLTERTLLVKRLECATKEIKMNTKSKKVTLNKLDEALENMEKLKQRFDQVSRDKVILEDKLQVLEQEYNQLKHNPLECPFPMKADMAEQNKKEHAVDKNESGDNFGIIPPDQARPEDFDISQSEKDMRKVQEKLLNLEKSLEKLKLREGKPNVGGDPPIIVRSSETTESIDTEVGEPVAEDPSINELGLDAAEVLQDPDEAEMDNEGLLRYNQFVGLSQESLMDEENESMQNLHMSFQETPDARVSFTNAFQNFLQAVNYTSTIKGPSDEYEDMLSTITEQSDASSDEEERTWPQDHRIVSSSPAFMEFLAKVLETPI